MPTDETIVLTTPEEIQAARLISMRCMLRLEMKGLRFRGGSIYTHIKRKFALRGNKQRVYDQFTQLLIQKGVLSDNAVNT